MQITLDLNEQQIEQLREIVDGLSIRDYGPLICKILPALPFTDFDPTPWCSYGHRTKESCDCGPIASNE